MIKKESIVATFLLIISYNASGFAKTNHIEHSKTSPKAIIKVEKPTPFALLDSQISIYSAHKEKNNYVIALYTNRSGKALITYDSPTCQANSYGNTVINLKNKSEINFISTEDPLCKITLQKSVKNQLKIIKETPACTTWHGDFCSFSSLSPLTRIYPQ